MVFSWTSRKKCPSPVEPAGRLWQEEHEHHLQQGGGTRHPEHPAPGPWDCREQVVDNVGDELARGDHQHVHTDLH